jgi:hypothetical protein
MGFPSHGNEPAARESKEKREREVKRKGWLWKIRTKRKAFKRQVVGPHLSIPRI